MKCLDWGENFFNSESSVTLESMVRCFGFLAAIFVSLLLGVRGFAARPLETFIGSKHFLSYSYCLRDCQRRFPGRYTPLELIRLDRLPEQEFIRQAEGFAQSWSALNQYGVRRSEESLSHLSCRANDALAALMLAAQRRSKLSLKGSLLSVLRAMPVDSRLALSPLDGQFMKSSEIGKKVQKDLASRPEMNLQAVSVDEDGRLVSFEGQPGAWDRLNLAPKSYYELRVKQTNGDKLRFRGNYTNKSDIVSGDLVLRREDVSGKLFNPQDSSLLLFGEYPEEKNSWVDESGLFHYSGDGHNHSHRH